MSTISLAGLVRLRDTALRSFSGEWDWDAILNRELYPALKQLRRLVIQVVENVQPTVLTPTIFTSDQHNFTDSGLAGSAYIRISTSAEWSLTGMDATAFAVPLWRKTITNVGSFNLLIPSSSGSSSSGNQFLTPGGLTLALLPNDSVDVWRDEVTGKLRVV